MGQGILVLGMHRSGTSAITRVLNLLGCALSESLVGPSEGNELGHWEAAGAVALNDEILASAGSSWNDWGPINPDWHASGVRSQMLERVIEVVKEHKALGPLFVLKDPRLCRLADLWLDGMDAAGVDARVILMLRHPAEVAASLERRDLMTREYCQLLWLRHLLDAEHLSRGRKRIVCRYDKLLNNWHDTIDNIRDGLAIALPRNSPAAHVVIETFLNQDLRHHNAVTEAGLGNLGPSNWQKRTFEIMSRWSESGEDLGDHDELDRIRDKFDQTHPAFARLLLVSGHSGQFATGSHLQQELDEKLELASVEAEKFARQTEEMERLRTREIELADKVGALEAAYEMARAKEAAIRAEAEILRSAAEQAETASGEVDRLTALGSDLSTELDSLQTKLVVAQREVEQERHNRFEAEKRIATHLAELEEQNLRNAELAGRVSATESALLQRQEELVQVWNQLATAQQAAGSATTEATLERQRRCETESRLSAAQEDAARERALRLEAEVLRAKAESSAAESRSQIEVIRETSRAATDRLFGEIGDLTHLLQVREVEAADTVAARKAAEEKAERQTDELVRITAALVQESASTQATAAGTDWLRDLARLNEQMPSWWAMLPPGWRRKRRHDLYRRSGLFDSDQYLHAYPDVAASGMDPVRHYVLHGMAEGRDIWR